MDRQSHEAAQPSLGEHDEQSSRCAEFELDGTEDVRQMLKRTDLGEIRLDRDGRWFHRGEPFSNRKLVELFNRSVRPVKGGGFVVRIGEEIYPIQVEDTAYFVEAIDVTKDPPIIELSDGTAEPLALKTLIYDDQGGFYCLIHNGCHRARFRRNLWHALLDRIVERDDGIYLELGDSSVCLEGGGADET